MRLIKIGSSASCDIVLNSKYVSSHHADLTLLDNGDILIEDKNSTNGTFVGVNKIPANQEITIRRGDLIKFADTELVWGRIPTLENNNKYKQIVNIGSNFRNDVVVNNGTVSRYHACLKISKNGRKAFIVDNTSKNGTKVNGINIQRNQPVQVKRGDNIVCGNEDVTDLLSEYIPSRIPTWAWVGTVGSVAAVLIACLILFAPGVLKNCGGKVDPTEFVPSVTYVRAAFHYTVTLDENPFQDPEHKELLVKNTKAIPYQATAFFLDRDGRMATNRHVALPWAEEYRQEGVTENLRTEYKKYILDQLRVSDFMFFFTAGKVEAILQLRKTELGKALIQEADDFDELQAMIRVIQNSKIVISGEMDYITVGYAGHNYTHEDEFQRCFVVCESGTVDKDLAILQLNDKKTPDEVKCVLNPLNIIDKPIQPAKDHMYTIGYPAGLNWGLDKALRSLLPSIKDIQCSKAPSHYELEFNSSTVGGASGSPVFNKNGQLVGVLSKTRPGQDVTIAVHARFLKKMYEEEVGK